MKAMIVLPTVAASLLMTPAVFGQNDDPFGGTDSKPDRPLTAEEIEMEMRRALPKLIQVQIEWIEVDHKTLTELMFERNPKGDSTPLRREVQELVRKDKANVFETAIVLARPGQKATIESISEHIYPTEYEPPELSNSIDLTKVNDKDTASQLRTPATPTAFETRNVGSTFEIEPNVGADDRVIDLRMAPELVFGTGQKSYQEMNDGLGNKNEVTMPSFYSLRTSTGLTIMDGEYRLAGVLTPKGDNGESDFKRKLMLFVKCDVVAVGEEALERQLQKAKAKAKVKKPKKK